MKKFFIGIACLALMLCMPFFGLCALGSFMRYAPTEPLIGLGLAIFFLGLVFLCGRKFSDLLDRNFA